ncbi:MAG: DUF3667 domain-containing protein [Flavobacteriaceae bacterium]
MEDDKPILPGKGRYQLKYRGTECLNCGHPLDMGDRYCPFCSQANSTKKLTLRDFLDEFLSSLISYDSRLAKTLGALLWRPGKITRDYINGRRICYTNPFRFLLSLGIIYFLLIGYSSNFEKINRAGAGEREDMLEKIGDLPPGSVNITKYAVEIGQEQDSLQVSGSLSKLREKRDKKDSTILADPKAYFKKTPKTGFGNKLEHKQDFFYAALRKDTLYEFDEFQEKYGIESSFDTKMAFAMAKGSLGVQRQPGTFLNKVLARLPFATFFFLPVFAIFIMLAYIRKKHTYTDHLVFSFHNQSLMFILLIISYLVDAIFKVNSAAIFILIFAVYLFIAMKRFYKQGFFKTGLKYIFLNGIFITLALFFAALILTGSIFTF